MKPAAPGPLIRLRDWYDIFTVDPATVVECPDCEERSPELDNVYALARWTVEHETQCPA